MKKTELKTADLKLQTAKRLLKCAVFSLPFSVLWSLPLWGLGGVSGQTTGSATWNISSAMSPERFSFLAGPQTLFLNGYAETGAALALRYRLGSDPTSTLGLTPSLQLSLEAGALLPLFVPAALAHELVSDNKSNSYFANLHSVTEEHAAIVADVPRWGNAWITPEAALGISFFRFDNDTLFIPPGFSHPIDNVDSRIGLYDRIGVQLQIPPGSPLYQRGAGGIFQRLSLLIDAGAIDVTDHADVKGVPIALTLHGWTMRVLVMVRL